jgi:hypothetical protein
MALSRVTPSGWLQETGTTSRVTPFGWVQETQAGTATATITDAGDELYREGDSVTITGTNFGATEGTVVISPTDDETDGAAVSQTVTAWADTSITITAVRGSLPVGTNLYLFVIPDTNDPNASGHVVQFEYVPIVMTWAM